MLEMVKVPELYSSGARVLVLALPTSSYSAVSKRRLELELVFEGK